MKFRNLLRLALGSALMGGWAFGGRAANAAAEAWTPLTPREVAVVANFDVAGSVDLARHYMEARGIPREQLLVTGMPTHEAVGRTDYERFIAGPIKEFLVDEKLDHVRCLVLMYGVPLKTLEPAQSLDEQRMERIIRDERERRLKELIDETVTARALAADGPTRSEAGLPQYDPKASVRDQIERLQALFVDAMTSAAEQTNRMAESPEREAARKRWLELWRAAVGYRSPRQEGIENAPGSDVPAEKILADNQRVQTLMKDGPTPKVLLEVLDLFGESTGSMGVLGSCDRLLKLVTFDWRSRAAVDSELCTLFWPTFPVAGHVPNPLRRGMHPRNAPRTLMACRLDGPSEEIVRRMIDTSLRVERAGLKGKVYLDTRGLPGSAQERGYGRFDYELRRLGEIVSGRTKLKAVVDERGELFGPGACPDAALYCGWYSLGRYIDAFEFVPGAVGWHIASSEAMTLHKAGSTLWCPSLLAHGVVATLGPVEEPYLTAFPLPSEFFGLLLTGRTTLAECYFQTTPYLSWMMTLIGDPLYNPFSAAPALEPQDLAGIFGE